MVRARETGGLWFAAPARAHERDLRSELSRH